MAQDTEDGFKVVEKKTEVLKKYKKVKGDIEDLKKKAGDSLEKKKSQVATQLSDAKELKNKYQKNIKTQFDKLLDINFSSLGAGKSSQGYLKRTFVTAIKEIVPKLDDILLELMLSAVGCSQDQEFVPQTIYIRVKSVDLLNVLKEDPATDVGKLLYEKKDIQYSNFPFSMNKELYNRIQNINQPFSVPASGQSYKGTSGQELFDISYVESYVDPTTLQTIQGNFFKVDLKNRITTNKISEFLKDYFTTIKLFDETNFFANLMNQLTGAVSIKKGDGNADLDDLQKILLIIQRILGLCFDNNKEIDVSGIAKLSENDNVDESFFEFTDIDLRFIDSRVSDIKLGIVEFEECETVKLPVDSDSITDALNNLIFVDGKNNSNSINDAANLTDVLTKNPGWFPLEINIDLSFLKEFPKAMVSTVLSPKVVLPLMITTKSLGQSLDLKVSSFMDFAKNLKSFFIKFASKVGELFVKILFDIIKKDILALVQLVSLDVLRNLNNRKLNIILTLTELLVSIAKLIKDFRECKSVIDDLLNVLNIASKGFNGNIPLPLLLTSRLLSGYSSDRAFLNVIANFEELGLPTGTMPDGSPNLMLASMKALLDGSDEENAANGKSQIAINPLSITPIGLTTPIVCFGK
jgi:hypothetical protein